MELIFSSLPAAILLTAEVSAEDVPLGDLQVGALTMGVLGGLALFLYGMDKLTDALRLVAGDRMKGFLARMTTNSLWVARLHSPTNAPRRAAAGSVRAGRAAGVVTAAILAALVIGGCAGSMTRPAAKVTDTTATLEYKADKRQEGDRYDTQ